jgi:hypothetical protein
MNTASATPAPRPRSLVWWILGGLLALLAVFAAAVWLMLRFGGYLMATVPVRIDPATTSLAQAPARLQAAAAPYDRWLALADAGMWAVHQHQLDEAAALGEELLRDAKRYPQDWNYGNALHKGHLILGRVALRRNDVAEARRRLLAAGQTPGSPQLDSFGPNMTLAEELLQRGEKHIVLEYLDLCASFWKLDNGSLAAWRLMIRNDKAPNFGAHLLY